MKVPENGSFAGTAVVVELPICVDVVEVVVVVVAAHEQRPGSVALRTFSFITADTNVHPDEGYQLSRLYFITVSTQKRVELLS